MEHRIQTRPAQRKEEKAFPHLEAKATLDAPLDALMLSQLTTKHCIPKGESGSKLRDKEWASHHNLIVLPWPPQLKLNISFPSVYKFLFSQTCGPNSHSLANPVGGSPFSKEYEVQKS